MTIEQLNARAAEELDLALDAWSHHNRAGYRLHLNISDMYVAKARLMTRVVAERTAILRGASC